MEVIKKFDLLRTSRSSSPTIRLPGYRLVGSQMCLGLLSFDFRIFEFHSFTWGHRFVRTHAAVSIICMRSPSSRWVGTDGHLELRNSTDFMVWQELSKGDSYIAIFRSGLFDRDRYLTVEVHVLFVGVLVDVCLSSSHQIWWVFEIWEEVLVQGASVIEKKFHSWFIIRYYQKVAFFRFFIEETLILIILPLLIQQLNTLSESIIDETRVHRHAKRVFLLWIASPFVVDLNRRCLQNKFNPAMGLPFDRQLRERQAVRWALHRGSHTDTLASGPA